MRISGVQYYWLIALGLIVGLVIGLGSPFYLDFLNSNMSNSPALAIGFLTLFTFAGCTYLVACWEIWDRFGLGAAIIAYIFFPLVAVYWFSRINGIEAVSGDA